MKNILSRLTPRSIFTLAMITEILLGVTYIGVLLSQNVGLPLYLFLQHGYQLIHAVALPLALSVTLRAGEGKRFYHGFGYLAILFAATSVKDFLMNFFSLTVESNYLAGDALLFALSTTALDAVSTLGGLYYFATYAIAYLFFYYARPKEAPPTDMWDLRASHNLRAACFVVCFIAIPEWIITLVKQIIFLVKDALWMPTPSEIVTMALDLICLPLFAFTGYCVVYMALRYGKTAKGKETSENTDAV